MMKLFLKINFVNEKLIFVKYNFIKNLRLSKIVFTSNINYFNHTFIKNFKLSLV